MTGRAEYTNVYYFNQHWAHRRSERLVKMWVSLLFYNVKSPQNLAFEIVYHFLNYLFIDLYLQLERRNVKSYLNKFSTVLVL